MSDETRPTSPAETMGILRSQLPWLREEFPEIGEITPLQMERGNDGQMQVLLQIEDTHSDYLTSVWVPQTFAARLHPGWRETYPEALEYLRGLMRADWN